MIIDQKSLLCAFFIELTVKLLLITKLIIISVQCLSKVGLQTHFINNVELENCKWAKNFRIQQALP